jgi:hypothetical protein
MVGVFSSSGVLRWFAERVRLVATSGKASGEHVESRASAGGLKERMAGVGGSVRSFGTSPFSMNRTMPTAADSGQIAR